MRATFQALVIGITLLAAPAQAVSVTDATGVTVVLPDQIVHVLPAGPPAALLLAAIAPELMMGWTHRPDQAADWLSPALAALPEVPRLTGRDADIASILAQTHPDLVLDYGDVAPRYAALAKDIRARGTPALLLDGALSATPAALRTLGAALHREAHAEALAKLAEALLARAALGAGKHTVMYLRGFDPLITAAPDSQAAELFHALGWTVLAPPTGGPGFRPVSLAQIAALDPDILVMGEASWRDNTPGDPAWATIRAVHTGQVMVAPALPFEWIAEPPSVNRLLGLAWLAGADPVGLFASYSAAFQDHVPSAAQLALVAAQTKPLGVPK